MENKNIVVLRHHPMNVKITNPFYSNQVDDGIENYIPIDVTSRVERDKAFLAAHPSFARDLSPFFIGPVTGPDGATAQIFEIFWQCGKVYPPHDDGGKPNAAFFEWRNRFYQETSVSKSLMRHACEDLGCKHGDCRYFAYFDKEKGDYVPLGYVESRKKVYIPEYAKLIHNTESFRWLQSLVNEGKKIALLDFDGFNYHSEPAMKKRYESYLAKCEQQGWKPSATEDDFLRIKTMKDVVNCSFLQVGHGFAIKLLLQGDIKIVNGEAVDEAGVLN